MGDSLREKTLQTLHDLAAGKAAASEKLFPIVYDELRGIAGRLFRDQNPSHTLQPTALVNEAYLRLVGNENVDVNGKTHLTALASKAMRQILIDHYRKRNAAKRGQDWKRVTISGVDFNAGSELDFQAVHETLETLEKQGARHARVVELRFFGGLNMDIHAPMSTRWRSSISSSSRGGFRTSLRANPSTD